MLFLMIVDSFGAKRPRPILLGKTVFIVLKRTFVHPFYDQKASFKIIIPRVLNSIF